MQVAKTMDKSPRLARQRNEIDTYALPVSGPSEAMHFPDQPQALYYYHMSSLPISRTYSDCDRHLLLAGEVR
jgi:hypothetical protein